MSEKLVLDLDRLVEHRRGDRSELTVPGNLQAVGSPYSPGLLARPRGERPVVEMEAVALAQPEPLHLLRRQLEREYPDRITVLPAQVLDFLETRVSGPDPVEARQLHLASLDDFLAFEVLRRSVRGILNDEFQDALSRRLRGRYEFQAAPTGEVDNEWIHCDNFLVRKLDMTAKVGERHAE